MCAGPHERAEMREEEGAEGEEELVEDVTEEGLRVGEEGMEMNRGVGEKK